MRSTLLLINKYFWRGYIGPIFAYFVPLVLTVFIGRITGPSLIIPGVFMIPALSILLIFMPQSIFEFRNSSLIKRIGNTPIKPIKFLLAIGIFNSIIVITAFMFLFLCCFIVFYDSLSDQLQVVTLLNNHRDYNPTFMYMIKHADWWSYVYSQLVLILETILVGLILSSLAKSSLFIQASGISLMLITLFLGPCVLPVSMVAKINVVKWFGYFLPLKYPIASSIEAFTCGGIDNLINNINNSHIFWIYEKYEVANVMINDLSVPFESLLIYNMTDKILNLVMPYIFIFIFLYLVCVTFRWNNRGKLKLRWNIIWELKNYILFNKKYKQDSYIKSNPDSEYILQVEHLTKSFKVNKQKIIADNDISFNVKKGRNLAILGANGAGKTVLTEIILGLDKPDHGNIYYNYHFNKTFKEGIGIQFQDSIYPYGIKTKDVFNFFINAYHLKISEQEKNDLINTFGIGDYWNKNIASLSGGQKQRINLLLAIIHKPKIIFLDELSTGLDIKIKNDIKKFIKNFAIKNDITIIIISHDMNEVTYLCDDIIVLKKGNIVDRTTTKKIIKDNKDLDEYLIPYL